MKNATLLVSLLALAMLMSCAGLTALLVARRKKFRSVASRPCDLMKFDFSEATKSLHESLSGFAA